MDRSNIFDAAGPRPISELFLELTGALDRRDAAADDAATFDAQDDAWGAVRAMAMQPAVTMDAFRDKARALRFAFEDELQGAGSDVALLASLLDDIEALTSAS